MKTLMSQLSKPLAFTASLALLTAAPLLVHAQGATGNESGGGYEKSMKDQGSTSINPGTKKKFKAAYSEVRSVQQDYSQKMQNVDDKSKAQKLQQEAQSEMISVIEDNGLSIEEYNKVVNKMRNDPELRKEIQQQSRM